MRVLYVFPISQSILTDDPLYSNLFPQILSVGKVSLLLLSVLSILCFSPFFFPTYVFVLLFACFHPISLSLSMLYAPHRIATPWWIPPRERSSARTPKASDRNTSLCSCEDWRDWLQMGKYPTPLRYLSQLTGLGYSRLSRDEVAPTLLVFHIPSIRSRVPIVEPVLVLFNHMAELIIISFPCIHIYMCEHP